MMESLLPWSIRTRSFLSPVVPYSVGLLRPSNSVGPDNTSLGKLPGREDLFNAALIAGASMEMHSSSVSVEARRGYSRDFLIVD